MIFISTASFSKYKAFSFTAEILGVLLDNGGQKGWELLLYTKLVQFSHFTCLFTLHVGVSSQVPYTAMAGMSVIPEVREAYSAVEKFQLVGAYGIQHRMVSTEGRPEIVLEGSNDGLTWTVRSTWERSPCYNNTLWVMNDTAIVFGLISVDRCILILLQEMNTMYKPGNVDAAPPIVGPHQPRLEWLMWQTAQEGYDRNPWFTGLIQRLLQGKSEGERPWQESLYMSAYVWDLFKLLTCFYFL